MNALNYSSLQEMLKPKHTPLRVWTARGVAMAADAIQIAIFPLFVPGGVSPVNDALDIAVAVIIIALLGWNWAFLPSAIAELVPFLDLVPSWTAAVLFVTRKGASAPPSADQPNRIRVASRVVE